MNYKEKAIKYAREVCPEIMKIDEDQFFTGDGYSAGKIIKVHQKHPFWFEATVIKQGVWEVSRRDFETNRIEILGHTLELSHWLRVLPTARYVVNRLGRISFDTQNFGKREIVAQYDLTKDGISQSEEFYKFICEVCNL